MQQPCGMFLFLHYKGAIEIIPDFDHLPDGQSGNLERSSFFYRTHFKYPAAPPRNFPDFFCNIYMGWVVGDQVGDPN